MKAFLILEDGTVFEGTQIGAKKEAVTDKGVRNRRVSDSFF